MQLVVNSEAQRQGLHTHIVEHTATVLVPMGSKSSLPGWVESISASMELHGQLESCTLYSVTVFDTHLPNMDFNKQRREDIYGSIASWTRDLSNIRHPCY